MNLIGFILLVYLICLSAERNWSDEKCDGNVGGERERGDEEGEVE